MWVYKLFFSISKWDTVLYFITHICIVVIPTATTYFGARLIDQVIALADSNTSLQQALSFTSPLTIILVLIVSFSFTNRIAERYNRFIFTKIRKVHLRNFEIQLLAKISTLDVIQFENPHISNTIRKAQDNVYKIEVLLQTSVSTIARLISTIISGVITFSISPVIFVFIIVVSIPNNMIFARFIKDIWHFYNSTIEKRRKSWRLMYSLTYEKFMPEYRISQANWYIKRIATRLNTLLVSKEIRIHIQRLRREIIGMLVNYSIYIITPLFLINQVLRNSLSIGSFTFYQAKILDFSRDLDYTVGSFLEISDTAIYIGYIRNLMELKPEIIGGKKVISAKTPPLIELKNVSFKYPMSKRYALRNISMTIKPGDEIAIVGKNGAGKSTLIKLILRFYDPTEGEILINNIPIKELSLSSYYNTLGAIFQDYNDYGILSVKQNIAIGDPIPPISMKDVTAAAKNADAHMFISQLDASYDQILTKDMSGGTNLSTGQWQKIALARMFYRNRPILILDEPTASIDAEAEYKIFKRIYHFIENKTVIIISHRFSTVRNAMKIYVIDDGKIIESGSHKKLLAQNGTYAHAFKLQAEGYTKT